MDTYAQYLLVNIIVRCHWKELSSNFCDQGFLIPNNLDLSSAKFGHFKLWQCLWLLQRVEPQVFDNHNIPDQPITAIVATPVSAFQQHQHHCFGGSIPQKESPLSSNPSIFLCLYNV